MIIPHLTSSVAISRSTPSLTLSRFPTASYDSLIPMTSYEISYDNQRFPPTLGTPNQDLLFPTTLYEFLKFPTMPCDFSSLQLQLSTTPYDSLRPSSTSYVYRGCPTILYEYVRFPTILCDFPRLSRIGFLPRDSLSKIPLCVCTSPLSPPNSVFSLAQVHHL